MKFIKVSYIYGATTDGQAKQHMKERAILYAHLCNKHEGMGDCTVGYMPCPFLLDDMPYALDKMCDNIKPEDWLRHLEVV